MNPSLCVPKLCGADVELGNFILGGTDRDESGREASRALLGEIAALSGAPRSPQPESEERRGDPQDWGRSFLPTNGGCAYIDLDHLELCLPEVLSAWDHVACWHAMLRLAREAQRAANAGRDAERPIQLLANNSDGHGHSYGSHLDFLVSRAAFDNVVHRKPHYLAYLAAFQASSLPITGQGKVGSENGAPWVPFQLSQRADFIETVTGTQTTAFRPLINTRDEPLCGRAGEGRRDLARLHVISFDANLCQVAGLLKIGTMQLILALIEAGDIDSSLALEDPLHAVRLWSHDPSLETRAPLVSGEEVTAVELQRRFLHSAGQFVAAGGAHGIVPRADEIIALWSDTLAKLTARDWGALARRLDWVLKLWLLRRSLEQRPDLRWDSAEIKTLDHLYASLDPTDGLYWSFDARGLTERVVSDAEIDRFVTEPPANTRAWGRTMLHRLAGAAAIQVDWDFVRLGLDDGRDGVSWWRIDLADPLGATRDEYAQAMDELPTMRGLLATLGATRESPIWTAEGVSWRAVSGDLAGVSGTEPRWSYREPETSRARWRWDQPHRNNGGGSDGIP